MKRCRFCGESLELSFVDLGMSPLCETVIRADQLDAMEPFYPLHAKVCPRCWLVQLAEYVAPAEIFGEYAYFSSYSDSWVEHARRYADAMIARWELGTSSRVIEIASNDGYLLHHFATRGIPVLGIEPASNVAEAARRKGITTEEIFLGERTAWDLRERYGTADLMAGNNVLAHVPDLNDFVAGLKVLLGPRGVLTMEFPHLLRLIDGNQFDTIYHEHFSYFWLGTARKVFRAHGLELFDVEELPTHGGSLRIYARHAEDNSKPVGDRVAGVLDRERTFGREREETYSRFGDQVRRTKWRILEFLIEAKRAGKRVVGYGAPGKGTTLLNYCGIRSDFLEFTVDRNPYKQGAWTPGTRIPIHSPDAIRDARPDYVFVLPWNLREEIFRQCAYIREWGGRFVVPIPSLEVADPPGAISDSTAAGSAYP
jgi:hypothetical protein